MNTYRVILTFEARDVHEAAEIVTRPERLRQLSRMRIQDVDRQRTIRLALVLGATIAFWVAFGTGLVHAWRMLP
jgi:hypothetical protein